MTRELKLPNGSNVYVTVAEQCGCTLLQCVWFGGREDLGDQIFCEHEGQGIWVADYHLHAMEVVNDAQP